MMHITLSSSKLLQKPPMYVCLQPIRGKNFFAKTVILEFEILIKEFYDLMRSNNVKYYIKDCLHKMSPLLKHFSKIPIRKQLIVVTQHNVD